MKKLIPLLAALLVAAPGFRQQQQLTPLQQYLYSESGYAPPQLAREQAPQPYPQSAPPQPYATAQVPYNPPAQAYGYEYEEESEIGTSDELRSLLTAAGN